MKTIIIPNDLKSDIKVAHCDCHETYHKANETDAVIRKTTGKVCLDCSSKIVITLVTADRKPEYVAPSAAQLEADLKSTWNWLGV
jgi:hypothetical protein